MGHFDDQIDFNCVIFDIDGTLSDVTHRRHHVTSKPKNWAAFNEAMAHDKPVENVARLARLMNTNGYKPIMCSGREEVFRDITTRWLKQHLIPCHALYMRPEKDYRDDGIIKSELLDRILADKWKPWFVVEDRDRVVKTWRERGLLCFQCAPGDF